MKLDFRDPETEAAQALRRWWGSLEDHRGDRAALRRARTVTDCAFIPGFHHLRNRLGVRGDAESEALACVAAVVASVRAEPRRRRPLPVQMAAGERPAVSELRLQRLLRAEGTEDVIRFFRRTVHQLGDEVELTSLARAVHGMAYTPFRDATAKWIAFDYYGAGAEDDTSDADAT